MKFLLSLVYRGGLAGCLLLGLPAGLLAQPHLFHFQAISNQAGLSQNTVNTLLQDRHGFLWVGTKDGLNRYDGNQFQPYFYQQDDPNSLGDNHITTLLEDSQGRLWVGTHAGGLALYLPELDRFERLPYLEQDGTGIGNKRVTALSEGPDGRIWVGTEGRGITAFDPLDRSYQYFEASSSGLSPKGPASNAIGAMKWTPAGLLWVGTDQGLSQFDPKSGTFLHFQAQPGNPESLSNNFIYDLAMEADGTLWIGTHEGLNRFDPHTQRFTAYLPAPEEPGAMVNPTVRAVLLDAQGQVWVGTEWGLRILSEEGQWLPATFCCQGMPRCMEEITIWSLLRDRENNIWVGTYKNGLRYFNQLKNQFNHFHHDPADAQSLSNEVVMSLVERGEKIYLGTDGGGINVFDKQRGLQGHFRWPQRGQAGNAAKSVVLALASPPNSPHIWAGTYEGGLKVFDPTRGNFEHFLQSIPGDSRQQANMIWGIGIDPSFEKIWLATYQGLHAFDLRSREFTSISLSPEPNQGPSDEFALCLEVDHKGKVWVGTVDGLFVYDPHSGQRQVFTPTRDQPHSLSHPVVNCVYEDRRHFVWIGTHGGGLNRFDPQTGRFLKYGLQDGLLSDVINGITEDLRGHLWISTNRGVSRLDPELGTFQNYTRQDGLQGGEYSRNAILTDTEGFIYLGGSSGFDRFHPDNLRKNQHRPEVHLTGLTFNNQPATIDPEGLLPRHPNHLDKLVLPYWQNDFSLSYVGLDFSSPQQVTYTYRLMGYDDQWQTAGSRRTAHYTNLDPGSYTFQVRAANSDGLWTANPKTLHIVITPPWWATLWFRFLALSSILAAVLATIWWREQATLRQKKRLERLVNERTHDLRQANEVLSAQKQQIESQKEEIQRQSQITLQVQQEINRLKQEQLEGQIDLKNRELAAQALHIVQKNEFLSKLGQEVEQLFSFLPDKYHGKMKEVSRELQYSMQVDTEWENFKLSFERVHPDFFKSLNEDYPQLTQNDLKQCAFIRMGLAKKEIATMLHVTPRGVTMARNRIKKKLGLEAGEDLRAFINRKY